MNVLHSSFHSKLPKTFYVPLSKQNAFSISVSSSSPHGCSYCSSSLFPLHQREAIFSNFLGKFSTEVLCFHCIKVGLLNMHRIDPKFSNSLQYLADNMKENSVFQTVLHLEIDEILLHPCLVQPEQLHFYLFRVLGFQANSI